MVRRRLNKKVAFIGSAFFVIIALVFIIVVLQFNRSAEEFVKDAEAARQTARNSNDENVKTQQYEIAQRKYASAFSRAATNEERKQILFDMADMFIETRNWPYVLDCWDKILLIEPENVNAQFGRLRYFEILGDSGIPNVWPQIYEYSSKFLELAQENELINKDMSSLLIPELEQGKNETQKLGTYLYLTKGKSIFQQAAMGTVTNIDEMLSLAVADFEKAKELEPNNVDVYLNLAKTIIAKGEYAATKGSSDERDKSKQDALTLLEEAVNNSTNKIKANINLLSVKLVIARGKELEEIEEQFKTLETEYMALVNKFSTSSEVYEALSEFYWIYSQYTKLDASRQNLDKSIDAISKAIELDENNAVYAIQATDRYYKRFSIYKNETDLPKAIEIARNALSWPDTQNVPGPRNNIRITNKFLLNSFLANSYIEQIVDSQNLITDDDKVALLSDAQEAVHEIEMILRTDEDPKIIRWQGMLELARGNKKEAIVKLNKAYEQIKSTKPSQPPWSLDIDFARLSYTLAKLFMDTQELGKVHEYLVNAHYAGITEIKPQARLDYVEVILQFNRFADALENINSFEEDYGPNKRSSALRIRTYIYSNEYEKAQDEIEKLSPSDAETIQLRLALLESRIRKVQLSLAQLEQQGNANPDESQNSLSDNHVSAQELKGQMKSYTQEAIKLIEELLDKDSELVQQSSVINICRNCIINDDIESAKQLVNLYLAEFPDNLALSIYNNVLLEPDPENITQQRYTEIEENVISDIANPIERAANLGIFYKRINEIPKAVEQLNIALNAVDANEVAQGSPEMKDVKLAVSHLFEIALATGNEDVAVNVVNVARKKNLDDYDGRFYDARLTAIKGDLKNALMKIDECLKEYPVSSKLYMLRSSINAAIGDEYAYMEDISKAAFMNPTDGSIARRYAIALYNRDQSSQNEVPTAQYNETLDALEKAITLNQGDLELLGLYAGYIAPTEPSRAIAISQDILAAAPNLDNAMKLATIAMNLAVNTTDTAQKEVFFDIAGSAFEQAREMDPNDRDVLIFYSNYLRTIGREDQAKTLLESSKDSVLVANDYFLVGDYENARKVLEQLYNTDSNNVEVLRGLMLVTQKMGDTESVKKYSDKLISVENNANNLMLQIKTYINAGLYKDAEYKLQSLKERYPDEQDRAILQSWLVFRQGNTKKALETLNEYLQVNQTNPSAWQLRSEINTELKEYDRAISDLKTCKSLNNDPLIGILLANVYIQVSKYQDAEAELKEILSKPNPPMEANLLLESVYLRFNRKTALENLYDKMIKQFPDSIQWLHKAAAYASQVEDYNRAAKLYKKSCEIIRESYTGDKQGKEIDDDLFVDSLDGYLQALLDGTGDIDKEGSHPEKSETVIEEAGKYLDTSYAPLAYCRMTMAYLRLRREDEAEKYAHLALDTAVTSEKYAFRALHDMYPIMGLDEIVKKCAEMLEKDPNSIEANYTLYYVLRLSKQYKEAVFYIKKCIDMLEEDSPIRLDYILKKDETLLFAYSNTSDSEYIDEAIDDYKSLLSEMPNNIQVLNNLAYVLAESERSLSEALEYSERVQQIKPNDPGFLDTYAFVLLKSGKYSEAEQTVEKSLKEYTMQGYMTIPAEVYEHKGMIKEKLEKNEEALTAYKRALELGSGYFTKKTIERINEAIKRVSP